MHLFLLWDSVLEHAVTGRPGSFIHPGTEKVVR